MNKGKVIDIQEKYVIVMNDQMAYEKIENKNGLSIGKEIYYFEEDLYKERKQAVKKYFLVAAVIFMMLFIQPLLVAEEAYGYISVDINPSIELQVNKNLEVLSLEAINTDAKEYVKKEWIGKSAREVINLIIEETKSKGILNKERNFVLVSYYFNDENTSSEEVFVQSLDKLFNEKPHDYSVAVIKSDAETYLEAKEAKEAKESLGKQVVNKKMNTKVDDLLVAKETIENDEDFKKYKDNDDSDEEQKTSNANALEDNSGQKNEKNPIFGDRDDVPGLNKQENESGDDDGEVERVREEKRGKAPLNKKAIEALAFDIIGGEGEIISFEFDRDDDSAEYEIEILYKDQIHEMEFNGFTGELMEHEIEASDDDDDDQEKNDDDAVDDRNENKGKLPLNRKAIEALAFVIIGGEGEIINFEFDRDDEELEYELEILFKGQKHEMKFNGFTGELMKREIEAVDDNDDNQEKNDDDALDDRNENQGKSPLNRKDIETLAFDIIGGEGETIKFEFDRDDDEAKYELEILYLGQNHEMEFNGFTGELMEHEIEAIDDEKKKDDDADDKSENKVKTPMNRGAVEALTFELIGGKGEIIKFEFDDDDNSEHEIEILYEGQIHEIKFNGFTGEVIEYDAD